MSRPQHKPTTPPGGFAAIRSAEPISHQWTQALGVIPLPQRLLLLVGATLCGAKGRRPLQRSATPPGGFAAIRSAEPISHQWTQAPGVITLPQRLLLLVGATLCGRFDASTNVEATT